MSAVAPSCAGPTSLPTPRVPSRSASSVATSGTAAPGAALAARGHTLAAVRSFPFGTAASASNGAGLFREPLLHPSPNSGREGFFVQRILLHDVNSATRCRPRPLVGTLDPMFPCFFRSFSARSFSTPVGVHGACHEGVETVGAASLYSTSFS